MTNSAFLIKTPRLLLRPMRADDLQSLLAIFGDPSVMAAFEHPPFDETQMHAWLERNLDHQHVHGFGLFAVLLKENQVLIGDCGLELMDVNNTRVAELGYDFRSDHWNRGYATEAASAVRDFAFHTLHLPRLISLIREGNHASRRVAEKVGMQLEATSTRFGRTYWEFELHNNPHTSV